MESAMIGKNSPGDNRMKQISSVAALLIAGSLAPSPLALAFQCNVCHSRNPAMVSMHKAVQAKEIGCFDCHNAGERLLGKSASKDLQPLLNRRNSAKPCVECHIRKP